MALRTTGLSTPLSFVIDDVYYAKPTLREQLPKPAVTWCSSILLFLAEDCALKLLVVFPID